MLNYVIKRDAFVNYEGVLFGKADAPQKLKHGCE